MKKVITDSDPQELAKILADVRPFVEQIRSTDGINSQMRAGADSARADDTKKLKEVVVSWIKNADPPLDPESRDNRGIYHVATGRLICPIEYDWEDEK